MARQAKSKTPKTPRAKGPTIVASENYTCLLVDDSRFERRRIKTSIERADLDLTFIEVESIGDTRRVLEEQSIDLILLDNFLPDGQGLSLAEEISYRVIPTIMISDNAANGLADAALWVGCDAFIAKDDISPAVIGDAIRSALSKTRVAREADAEAAQTDALRDLLNEFARDCVMQLDTPVARMLSMTRLLRKQIDRGDTIAQRHSVEGIEELCISIQAYLDDINKDARSRVAS